MRDHRLRGTAAYIAVWILLTTVSVAAYSAPPDNLPAKLAEIDDLLRQFPPKVPAPAERHKALTMIDDLTRYPEARQWPAMEEFLQNRMRQAVEDIEKTKVDKGARIWKLYNHCFVVRTASVTLVFDLVRYLGSDPPFDIRLMERLITQCDVLVVSHDHGDHADENVTQQFLDAGKPVVGCPDVCPELPILRPERIAHKVQPMPFGNPRRELKIVAYPGHQERMHILNNVTLVITPEGLTFAHTGDQYMFDNDFVWMDEIAKHYRVDVLMANCWAYGFARMVKGFNPRLVMTGHENELGHPVEQRERYGRSYEKLQKCSARGLVMTWGESFRYKR